MQADKFLVTSFFPVTVFLVRYLKRSRRSKNGHVLLASDLLRSISQNAQTKIYQANLWLNF